MRVPQLRSTVGLVMKLGHMELKPSSFAAQMPQIFPAVWPRYLPSQPSNYLYTVE